MIFKLEYKKVIAFLIIGFIVTIVSLWYKQETTNKVIPKRASYVMNIIEWGRING